MTFREMAELFWQRIDQSGSPDFTDRETDRLLNWAYDVWYLIHRQKFDKNQSESVNMTHLLRPFTFAGTGTITVVGTAANIPDYRDLARMTASFNKTDCNGVTTIVNPNVVPMSISEVDTNRYDPFNSFTDEYPKYVQSNTGVVRQIEVFSATTPLFLAGLYFKDLQVIDVENSPTTQFEAQDYIARQIVDIAKILAKGDLDDYPAVKNAVQTSALTAMEV